MKKKNTKKKTMYGMGGSVKKKKTMYGMGGSVKKKKTMYGHGGLTGAQKTLPKELQKKILASKGHSNGKKKTTKKIG